MPSGFAAGGKTGPCLQSTCREPNELRAPTLLVRVRRKDTQALLDTGSIVTLLRPDLAGGQRGEPMEVTCVHGDTATYETCYVEVQTPRGMYTA